MKEEYLTYAFYARQLDEKLPAFFSLIQKNRDVFEEDYHMFMWWNYPKIEREYDFFTLYWVDCFRNYMVWDREQEKAYYYEHPEIAAQAEDDGLPSSMPESFLGSFLEKCDSFQTFFHIYCEYEHEKPFEKYSQYLTEMGDYPKKIQFQDVLQICQHNLSAAASNSPKIEKNTEHLLYSVLCPDTKSIFTVLETVCICKHLALRAILDGRSEYSPDYEHRKQIAGDWFEQSNRLLNKEYRIGDEILSFETLLEQIQLEAQHETAEDIRRRKERIDALMSLVDDDLNVIVLSDEEKDELDTLLARDQDYNAFRCRELLGKTVMELFSQTGIRMAYYHARMMPTEENMKEYILRVLTRQNILTSGKTINIFFDGTGTPYSCKENPVDIIREKSGYDVFSRMSVNEMLGKLNCIAATFERETCDRIQTVIQAVRKRLSGDPDRFLANILVDGRQTLDALSDDSVKLETIPSEYADTYYRRPDDFRMQVYQERTMVPSLSFSDFSEDYIVTARIPGLQNESKDKNRIQQWSDTKKGIHADTLKRMKSMLTLHDEYGELASVNSTMDWDIFRLKNINLNPENAFGHIVHFPSRQELYEEEYTKMLMTEDIPYLLINNKSLAILRDEKLPLKADRDYDRKNRFDINPLNGFDEDADFLPLLPVARKIQCRSFLLRALERIYNQQAELGYMLEELQFVNDLIMSESYRSLDNATLLNEDIVRIRKRIFQHEKRITRYYQGIDQSFAQEETQAKADYLRSERDMLRNQNEELKALLSFHQDIVQEYLDKFKIEHLEEVIQRKNEAIRECRDKLGEEYVPEYSETLMDQIVERIRRSIQQSNEMQEELKKAVHNSLQILVDNKQKIISLFDGDGYFSKEKDSQDTIVFDDMIQNAFSFLETGESLYNRYVPNSCEQVLSDYGCIAINYYKTIEYLANQLLYRPYYYAKLKDRRSLPRSNESAFCGDSFYYMTKECGDDYVYMDSLTYGTLAIFLLNIPPRPKNNEDYCEVSRFYTNKTLSVDKIKKFAKQMEGTSKNRNQCAHPSIKDKSFAVDARRKVYDKATSLDGTRVMNQCKELLKYLCDIFK